MDNEEKGALISSTPNQNMAEKINAGARAKGPLLEKTLPFFNQIIYGIVVILAAVIISGFRDKPKTRVFLLDGPNDYLTYSALEYTSGSTVFGLQNPEEYKTALKELQQAFGTEQKTRNEVGDEFRPGSKRAVIGISEDGNTAGRVNIILQVGKGIKAGNAVNGGTVWNWVVNEGDFKDGNHVLKRRMTDTEYERLGRQ
ncbi:MAG: hypothetical protein LBK74_08140 [Treponema sp.]|jgi:hypothetical protein|nr:hypothetical protein [Treponema sp.]